MQKPNIQKLDSVRHVIGRLFYFFTQFDVYCPHIVSTRAPQFRPKTQVPFINGLEVIIFEMMIGFRVENEI